MARAFHSVRQRIVARNQIDSLVEIVLANIAVLYRSLPERALLGVAAPVTQHDR